VLTIQRQYNSYVARVVDDLIKNAQIIGGSKNV